MENDILVQYMTEGEDQRYWERGEIFRRYFVSNYMLLGDVALAYVRAMIQCRVGSVDYNAARIMGRLYLADPDVAEDLKLARSNLSRTVSDRIEDHLEQLARIRDRALEADKFTAAATAEIARGRVQGFYSKDSDDDESGSKADPKKMSDNKLAERVAEVLAKRAGAKLVTGS